jgi:hypothetical protein
MHHMAKTAENGGNEHAVDVFGQRAAVPCRLGSIRRSPARRGLLGSMMQRSCHSPLQADEKFRLVGDAIVIGAMEGEFWKTFGPEDIQQIEIV